MKINFASTRLAFILIAILIIHIILAGIIPQKDIAENQIINLEEFLGDYYVVVEKLALDRIYEAPPFFVLLGLLALNLVLGNIKRFKNIYKVNKTLLKAQYIGSIIFHFSLVLIIISIILNYSFKFQGVFGLTEGQTGTDSKTSYFRTFEGPFYQPLYNKFQITLDNINTDYKVNNAFTNAASVSIKPSHETNIITEFVYTNHPLVWGNLEFHYGSQTGYSPEIILKNKVGDTIFSAFIRLAVQEKDGIKQHADFMIVSEIDSKIDLEIVTNEKIDSTKLIFSIQSHEKQLYSGVLKLKETVEFDDYTLTFSELRRWCYISVVKSPFLNLIFFGFWSALAGMVIGFIPRIWKENKNI